MNSRPGEAVGGPEQPPLPRVGAGAPHGHAGGPTGMAGGHFGAFPAYPGMGRVGGMGGRKQNVNKKMPRDPHTNARICFEYVRGACPRPPGTCRYSHNTPPQLVAAYQQPVSNGSNGSGSGSSIAVSGPAEPPPSSASSTT